MSEQILNAFSTTLAADLTASASVLTLAAGGNLPLEGSFRLRIGSEILICKGGRRGSKLVGLERGAESTSAATHASGTQVDVVWTAGAIRAVAADHRANIEAHVMTFVKPKAARLYLHENYR